MQPLELEDRDEGAASLLPGAPGERDAPAGADEAADAAARVSPTTA